MFSVQITCQIDFDISAGSMQTNKGHCYNDNTILIWKEDREKCATNLSIAYHQFVEREVSGIFAEEKVVKEEIENK